MKLHEAVFYWSTWQAKIQDFALISHAVPAAKLRALLPSSEAIRLDTIRKLDEQEEFGIVSTGCLSNLGIKPSLFPGPGIAFDQVTYRTYVHFRGKAAFYYFGTTLSRPAPWVLERSFARVAALGRFHLQRGFSAETGYSQYVCDVRCPYQGDLYLKLEASGTPSSDRLIDSLTYRLHSLFPSRLGITLDQIAKHPHLLPWTGRLIAGDFSFWKRKGLLSPDEAAKPISVLIQPALRSQFYPPIPAVIAQAALPARFAVPEHRLQF